MCEQIIYQSSERDILNVDNLNMHISAMDQQFVNSLFSNNPKVSIHYQGRTLNTNIPPHSFIKTSRTHIVQSFIEILKTTPICHIHGSVGIGKTQLALLIAESSKRTTYWFRLREYTENTQLVDNILQTIASLADIQPSSSQNSWLEIALQKLSGSLFVFDDLLKFQYNSGIAELISSICIIALKHNLRLIITSNFEPPFRLKKELGSQYQVILAPSFTDTEIIELFMEHGASNTFLSQYMNLIIFATNRHPMFLMAMISYLKQCDWKISCNNAPDLLTKQYATDVKFEAQDLVSKTLINKDKEMLYRLSLLGKSFDDQGILELSNVNPIILYPQESINNLIGVWLQKDSAHTYLVSPLISDLGKKNLAPNILKNIYNVIARSVLKKQPLSSSDGLYAIINFSAAEEYQDAAFILLSMLNSFIAAKDIKKDDWGVTNIWYDISLPVDLKHEVQILLRLAQIEACKKIGKRYNYLLKDLNQLSKSLRPGNEFVASLSIVATLKLSRINFDSANYFFQLAIQCKDINIQPKFPVEYTWESLIWILTPQINDSAKLQAWLQTFNMFSDEQLRTSEKGMIFKYTFTFIADNIWLAEHKKPINEQNWDQVLAALSKLEKAAIAKNSLLIWASAIRAQAIVLAEYKKDVKSAVHLAQKALEGTSDSNNSVKFLLSEIIGREYTIAKQYDKALPWFKIIFYMDIHDFVSDRIDTFILASEAFGEFDAHEAVKYTAKSVTLALENQNLILKNRPVQALAEHAIAIWIACGIKESFKTYELAVDQLFLNKDDSNIWKSLFVLIGHVSGYFLGIAQHGKPPEYIANGEIYAPPQRGMFRCFNPQAAQNYNATNDCGLCTQVSMFAESINNFESAEKWAIKAYAMGYGKSPNTFLLINSIPALIKAGRLVEALHLAEDIFAFTVASMITQNKTVNLNNIKKALGNRPSKNWDTVECQIALRVVLPSFIKIITLQLADSDMFETKVREFEEELKRIKSTAFNPIFWDLAIQIVLSLKTGNQLNDIFTTFKGDYYYKTTLHAMSYLSFSIKETPQKMMQYLWAVLPTIYEQLTQSDRLLIPVFADFIRVLAKKVFFEKRFYFSTPKLVEEELNNALLLPDPIVTPKILSAFSLGLNVSMPENIRAFIKKYDNE